MKCDDVQPLLLDYDEGRLSPSESEAVRRHLETCAECARERAELREMSLMIRRAPAPVPAPRVRASFQAWLESEQKELARAGANQRDKVVRFPWARHAFFPALAAAAASVIFAVGIFVGGRVSSASTASRDDATARELADLRRQVNSMGQVVAWSLVQQGTASDRLKAVLALNTASPANPRAVDELLSALAFDASDSVRLGAVEALYRHSSETPVRSAIASALPRESSPAVQLAMIDLLAATRDPAAATALVQFSRNESQGEIVRDAARHALAQM